MILIVPEKRNPNKVMSANDICWTSYDRGFNAAIDKIIELNKAANPNGMLVYKGIIKYDEVNNAN
jgi:hypothetical protein